MVTTPSCSTKMGGCSLSSQESPKESPSVNETPSAFDPENFNFVVLVQLMRLYDVGMALLSCYDEQKAATLAQMHEAGLSFTPNPAFAVMEDDDETMASPETTPEDL
ncbi:hypothetical protein PP459_gp005 [Streptomyces phage Wakanda]|uniref:Uncharacterized protein n=2 Tax=Wakandavirus TaxID=3044854 RepID=A0A6G8R315_9CAUD|nr:hypothetical protein PP459_gp005 [Streptomyces phage Wakanda]YP_010652320.1 hypothetical protein PP460_gp006 [Streptomyces phage Muntaha]QIN94001.1 hypothetical protein SEA_WAKANDA_5 [Streptomyces phage Wakanda]QIN94566.1 hypothetical protein SEA_MUNTAHA_6 [Streptomyces phage Muntaha]